MKNRAGWFIALFLPVAVLWFFPSILLVPLGKLLIETDPIERCDCLFVLAGDARGQRILRAAELYREGLASQVFVSGPEGNYGFTEDQLAIPFAKKKGAADVPFVGMPNKGKSTATEGQDVLSRLQAAGCRSVLVVTSNYHTKRSGRILRRVWPDMQVRMAAAPTEDFDPERWWRDRNHQKTFFFEWAKTVADWIGL